MNIQIKKLVKGALTGESGYTKIASTYEMPDISAAIENHGQNLFSPNYASLFAFRTDGKKSLSVVHIQGQHEGDPGRMYDTRNFYNIDSEEIRKCDSRIGAIINSLPKLKKFSDKELGILNNFLQVSEIQDVDNIVVANLQGYIIQAIIECKYLLIKLDSNEKWKENGVLENVVAKTLFAAIDKLPEKLRPAVSFALSADGNCQRNFIKNFLIILYHGNNDFGLTSTIEIDWKDIISKPNTKYVSYGDFYTTLAKLTIGNGADFFDTELSSMGMLLAIYEKSQDPNLKNSKEYLKIQKDWDKLIKNNEIVNIIKSKANNPVFDLSDIYNFFEGNKQQQIREKYADLFCQIKSVLPIAKQIETLKALLNIPSVNIEKDLHNLLSEKLILQILNQSLNFEEWLETAELVINTNIEQQFIEITAKQDLNFFEKLFKSGKYKDIAEKGFKETTAYKNNLDELCKKSFILYLPLDKKQELRKSRINNSDNYKELFAGITYAEINQLSVNFLKKIKFISKNDYCRFIQDNRIECEKQFEYEFINYSDIYKGEIYNLYNEANESLPKIDDIAVTERNLKWAFDNAKILNIDLSRRIVELYQFCQNVGEVVSILKITKQRPDEDTISKFKISNIKDLNLLIENELPIKKDKIDVKKLIDYNIPKKETEQKLRELLTILKKIEVPFIDCEQEIKRLSSKVHKEFFEDRKTAPNTPTANTDDINNKGKINKFIECMKEEIQFIGQSNENQSNAEEFTQKPKNIKTWSFIVIILGALGIGFGSGFGVGKMQNAGGTDPSGVANDTVQNQNTAKNQIVDDMEVVIEQNNDSIKLWYRVRPKDKLGNIEKSISYTEKNDQSFLKTDTTLLTYFIDNNIIWLDSVKTDTVFSCNKAVNGASTRAAFKKFIKSILDR